MRPLTRVKHLSPALLPVLLLGSSAYAQTSLSLASGSALKGATLSLNLSLTAGTATPAGLEWTLSYSPNDISSLSAAAGSALASAGKTLNCKAGTGSLICLASGMNANAIGSGVVAVVTVNLNPASTNTLASISMSNTLGATGNGNALSVSGTGGTITVTQSNPVPTISSLSPATATAGGAAFTLTVNGTGFVNGSVVRWNGSNRTTTFVSATQVKAAITAADIASAATAQVSVFNPTPGGGTSGNAAFTITATNPVPVVSVLSPVSVVAGSPAFTLTVNGTGFVSGSVVRWNGANRTTTFVSATQLQASITALDVLTALIAQVSVFNPTPGGGTSGNAAFTITASNPIPTVTSLAPTSATAGGAAFTLTVNGTGLVSGSVVRWNGSNRTTTFVSATQVKAAITAADIASAATSQVSVFNPTPGGGTSGNAAFTTVAQVTVTKLQCSPTSVTSGGTSSCTVTLSQAASSSTVVTLSDNSNSLTTPASVTLGAGAITGSFTVTAGTVTANTTVTLTAALNGSSVLATLTVTPTGTKTSTATFIKTDYVTGGSWKGIYGADGSNIIGDTANYPGYVTVTPSGNSNYVWSASTTDLRAPQKRSSATDRVAATWYSSSFSIDMNFGDGQTHQVAIYVLDWDGTGRNERVDVVDGNNNTNILDSRSAANFHNGRYLVWNLGGHVILRFTNISGSNAVVSGIYFGATPSISSSNSANYVQGDDSTSGSWKGVFGADGANVIGDTANYPAYVTVTPSGNSNTVWAASTSDLRAMQKNSSSTARVAAAWSSSSTFSVDLSFKDANMHRVALYLLDWDTQNTRSERVDVLDANNNLLDTRTASAFSNGLYLVWNLSSHVIIRVTTTGSGTAVLSGILFGSGPATVTSTATFVKTDATAAGTWKGVYGSEGFTIDGDAVNDPSYVTVTLPPASQASTLTWAASTTDSRALQQASSPTNRVAAAWYSSSPFSVDLHFNDANTHRVAIYLLDWDGSNSRSEQVDILDTNNTILNTQTVSAFSGGRYLVWNVTGHVVVRVTHLAGPNGVLSGIFFR